ncbi:MAG: hypothetical protein DRQ51_09900 [Gammaproteobacteria bacterium]|nr:MAG: hypothetical protein DRQ51_09900 [Gammaproteobacteria bacterium]
MLEFAIDDKNIENIFKKDFSSDKIKFLNFIEKSFKNYKNKEFAKSNNNNDFMNLQTSSIADTWNNDADKRWDEL